MAEPPSHVARGTRLRGCYGLSSPGGGGGGVCVGVEGGGGVVVPPPAAPDPPPSFWRSVKFSPVAFMFIQAPMQMMIAKISPTQAAHVRNSLSAKNLMTVNSNSRTARNAVTIAGPTPIS